MKWVDGDTAKAHERSLHLDPSHHFAILEGGNGLSKIIISGPSPQAALELRGVLKHLLEQHTHGI